jgi:hypothetical protein
MKERIAVQTSLLGLANKALSLAAEASIHEEPGAGKPHAGICAGCALKAFEVQSPEMVTVVKLSQQPRIESCVVDR